MRIFPPRPPPANWLDCTSRRSVSIEKPQPERLPSPILTSSPILLTLTQRPVLSINRSFKSTTPMPASFLPFIQEGMVMEQLPRYTPFQDFLALSFWFFLGWLLGNCIPVTLATSDWSRNKPSAANTMSSNFGKANLG